MNFSFLRFDSIDSTNIEALKQVRLGADEGLCVVARQQTAGRGRQGRFWSSPMDAGLYLSVVLRPTFEIKDVPLITLTTAIAVSDALTELGAGPDIKWPNDVLIKEKKICGILAETTDTDRGLAVVVGIGINVTSDSFPSELAESATSVENELDQSVTLSDLERTLVRHIDKWYRRLCGVDGPASIIAEWSKRSTYSQGKHVRVALSNETITGLSDGLEQNGALRVRRSDGSITTVQAGDVERLRLTE
jgi:BirA family transcriptional regulator, biotin operon repressor / biotin---[acetyl-CoA-carboxylase] ligase